MPNEELITFDLFAKTVDEGALKQRVYKFPPKYLRRLKEIRFFEPILLADVPQFEWLKNIQMIDFRAGIESLEVLKALGAQNHERLTHTIISEWSWTDFDWTGLFPHLNDISLDMKVDVVRLKLPPLNHIGLWLNRRAKIIDCRQGESLTGMFIRAPEPTREVHLPAGTSNLSMHHNTGDVDLSSIHIATESLASLDIRTSGKLITKPGLPSMKSITELQLLSNVEFESLPDMFPSLQTLYLSASPNRSEAGLLECLKRAKQLRKVHITDADNLSSDFFARAEELKITLTASAYDREYSGGEWVEVSPIYK